MSLSFGGTGKRVQHFVRFTFLLPGVEKPGTGPHPGSLDAADTSVCATRRGARTLARRIETFTINGLHSMLRKLSDIGLKPVGAGGQERPFSPPSSACLKSFSAASVSFPA